MLCRKLARHPVPRGWRMACEWSLWTFTVMMPIATTLFMKYIVSRVFVSFLVVVAFASLFEVANYIEVPYRCCCHALCPCSPH